MMAQKQTRIARTYMFAALLFSLAGLVWFFNPFVDERTGLHTGIGMANVCIGLVFFSLGRHARRA